MRPLNSNKFRKYPLIPISELKHEALKIILNQKIKNIRGGEVDAQALSGPTKAEGPYPTPP
jgi:hypothetical protein